MVFRGIFERRRQRKALLATVNALRATVEALEVDLTQRLDMRVHAAREAATPCLLQIQSADESKNGTGFLVTEDGFVLTAYHVRTGQLTRQNLAYNSPCRATLFNGTVVPCEPVEDFPDLDLSLMKMAGRSFSCFETAIYVTEDKTVAVIGYCLEYEGTLHIPNLTIGRVSTVVHTALTLPNGVFMGPDAPHQLCTANVNTGDSGAPVFDLVSLQLLGVFRSLHKRSEDQGQAVFMDVTRGAGVWPRIRAAIDRHRAIL
ncbi:hypothetical protein V7S43_012988 [Phytophthora oleae]|uniref:Serine protease n=1 Tax=Phytophthora oleae TaxID=2107226 RepID=A0ABD3F7C4_9STRA